MVRDRKFVSLQHLREGYYSFVGFQKVLGKMERKELECSNLPQDV